MKPIKHSELFDAIVAGLGVAEQVAVPSEVPETGKSGRPLRILLAEDSEANRRLAVGLLSKWGHQVTVAVNGREAVAKLAEGPFDLVLMDIQMPEMDGYQATARIRQGEAGTGKHVAIVAMTAHALKGDREKCLAAGMDGYVSKPIRKHELRHAIEEFAAPGAAPADLPTTLDWNVALECVGGDRELLREVCDTIIEECPRCLAQLDQALRDSDAHAMRLAAHTIRGQLRLFGTTRGEALAAELEKLGSQGRFSGAAELVAELRLAWESALHQMQSTSPAEP